MFSKDLKGQLTAVNLLPPGSKANTAAATSTGLDTQQYEGDLLVTMDVATGGTGTLDGKIQDSADNSAWADVSGLAGFTQVATAVSIQTMRIDKRKVRRYIRFLGTIVTGPYVMDVLVHGQLKTQ